MPSRVKYLIFSAFGPRTKGMLLLLLFLLGMHLNGFSQQTSDDVKKTADKLFEDEDFVGAYKLYAQLVSNYPKDVEYNFRLGVCMIYAEPDKKKCISYLQFANGKGEEAPKETKFYLGKAYHINYLFDEAIKFYNEYKKVGSSAKQKKLQVDREIKACGYGKRLLSNMSDLEVLSKKTLNESDYFRSYDLKDMGGKLLVKPEDFRTATDKKKKEKSVLFKPKGSNKVYYSSYGSGDESGRDIYTRELLPNGEYGPPQKLKGINTEFDEDYPFLHPNGNVLYFSSKGYNSMGGYDVFRSTYIPETDSWSQPVNMEFPVNSPDDDYLYVTDSLEKVAFFSTGRQSLPGKIDVLKINTERKPIDILALNGTVVKEASGQSLQSKITVKNMDDGKILGIYEARENGDYYMDLPNGAKLLYTVETPGLQTQSERVALPLVQTSKPLRQTISYDKGILKIINYFDEPATDDSYVKYLKIIEQKAKLDVNAGQNKIQPSVTNKDTLITQKGTGNTDTNKGPVLVGDTATVSQNTANVAIQNKTQDNKSIDNKQLASIAKQDAEESKKEALALQQDANDATELGNAKKIEAQKKLTEAEDLFKNAEAITDETTKKETTEKAIAIKADAESEMAQASKIIEYGQALQKDAENKKQEAILNDQYSKELEALSTAKKISPQTTEKLESLQKQINELSAKNSGSDAIYNEIKNQAEEKEKEYTTIEQKSNTLKSNINEIKAEISNSEQELANTRKKKDKEPIQAKIAELNTELKEKEQQLAANETILNGLKPEMEKTKSGLEIANKIKSENIAAPVNADAFMAQNTATTAVVQSNTPQNVNKNIITGSSLSDKYSDKIVASDPGNKNSLEEANKQLNNFNQEINSAISKNKAELAKTKSAGTKQQINDEIKQLESLKKQNQDMIAANNKQLSELNKPVAADNYKGPDLNPISSNNPTEATAKLNSLGEKLTVNENQNFEFNGYQDSSAQKLKVEADALINETAAQQRKLKDELIAVTEQIKNTAAQQQPPKQKSAAEVTKEYEDLHLKAEELRTEANSKSGAEKEELLTKAKETEKLSNERHLEAALLISSDNKSVFETNSENISTLKNLKKATEVDLSEVNRLIEESNTAFKQAKSIREEANALSSTGAKLGNYTNAEEIEAEAISKQEQAIFILKKTSGNVALKTAPTSSNTTASIPTATVDLSEQLKSVNNSLSEISAKKANAYVKLYEANTQEQTSISNAINTNSNTINQTPALKSEFIAASNKLKKANEIKQRSENESDNNKKVNDLVTATKLQTEALQQLQNLNKKAAETLAKNTNTPKNNVPDPVNEPNKNNEVKNNNNVVNNNTENKTQDPAVKNQNQTENNQDPALNKTENPLVNNNENKNDGSAKNQNIAKNNEEPVANNNANKADDPTKNQNTGNNENVKTDNNQVGANNNEIKANESATNSPVVNKITEPEELDKRDTTTKDLLANVVNSSKTLNNQGANQQLINAVSELKKIQEERSAIANSSGSGTSGETAAKAKTKADEILMSAEDLSNKSIDYRNQANTKSGAEKDSLLKLSERSEQESQTKKLEAIELTQTANEAIYKNNLSAITELITKAKTDNPALVSQLESKLNDVNTLKNQSVQLRNESSSLTNNSAKIGGMMNAEEKESELLAKQNEILEELKKQYPDYVMKEAIVGGGEITNEQKAEKLKELDEKEFTQLTSLTNAYSLEFETSKDKIPVVLDPEQAQLKDNADKLNSESKRLLIQSASESDPAKKSRMLNLAVKTGKAATEQLERINSGQPVASNNKTNKAGNQNKTSDNIAKTANNTNPTNKNVGNVNAKVNETKTSSGNENAGTLAKTNAGNNARTPKGAVKIEGLEVTANNAYNANRPIPIDAKMPDGLVFRVQIGAFKNTIANNSFGGLTPVNGESTANGYIRYTAGNFNQIENANAVKNDLKNLGYNDAFVVAYFNGKRVTVAEALALMAKEGKTIDNNAPSTAGITANANIPKASQVNNTPNIAVADAVSVTKELEQINGLLYTVQIGVYTKQVSKRKLFDLQPIYTEKLPSGLYRYTAGIYNNTEKIITDKNRVVGIGVKDAFVSAYLNGKRISFAEGKSAQQDSTTKMETENPIVFPQNTGNAPNAQPIPPTENNTPAIQPFNNGVSSYPAATPENGIKPNEEGVTFKVQIGAYSKQVPKDVAAKFMNIKTWPVENKQINNLFIYNIGNFSGAGFAKSLKDEAVRAGITDAFITVYRDGKKLYGQEAADLLNQR